jgi:hypothetical protein
MFTITPVDKRDNVSTPTTPPSNSSMSISPPPSSSNLFYISIDRVASPKPINTNPDSSSEPKGYQFGDTERINPLHFQPVKLEDGEVSNDSQSLLPPAPFTPARPAQIQVKVRNFEEAHNLREAEAKPTPPPAYQTPNLRRDSSQTRVETSTSSTTPFTTSTARFASRTLRPTTTPPLNGTPTMKRRKTTTATTRTGAPLHPPVPLREILRIPRRNGYAENTQV